MMQSISSLNLNLFIKKTVKTFLFSKAFHQEFQHCKLVFYFASLINFLCKAQLNIFIETARYKFLLKIIIIIIIRRKEPLLKTLVTKLQEVFFYYYCEKSVCMRYTVTQFMKVQDFAPFVVRTLGNSSYRTVLQ